MTAGIAGIIQIIVLLLPVILAAIAAKNTPKQQLDKLNEISDKAVVTGDVNTINTIIHDSVPSSDSNTVGQISKV
jgi:hypothetical protein